MTHQTALLVLTPLYPNIETREPCEFLPLKSNIVKYKIYLVIDRSARKVFVEHANVEIFQKYHSFERLTTKNYSFKAKVYRYEGY